MASHSLRSFLSLTRQLHRPCAVFYLDIKSAYYRLVRSAAVGPTCTEHDLAPVLTTLQLPPDVQQELHRIACDPDAFTKLGCPDWLRRFGSAFHSNTWFHVRGDQTIAATLRGTRPGDGYAGLLFNAVLGVVLRDIEAGLQARGLDTTISWDGRRYYDASPDGNHGTNALHVVWADDIAVMIFHDSPALLMDAVPIVLAEHVDRLAAHGLFLNFEKGKTELLVLQRGAGSRKLRREFFAPEEPKLTFDTAICGPQHIRLVAAYGMYCPCQWSHAS